MMNRIEIYTIDLTLNLLLHYVVQTNVITCSSKFMNSFVLDFVQCELPTHKFKYQLEDLLQ